MSEIYTCSFFQLPGPRQPLAPTWLTSHGLPHVVHSLHYNNLLNACLWLKAAHSHCSLYTVFDILSVFCECREKVLRIDPSFRLHHWLGEFVFISSLDTLSPAVLPSSWRPIVRNGPKHHTDSGLMNMQHKHPPQKKTKNPQLGYPVFSSLWLKEIFTIVEFWAIIWGDLCLVLRPKL